MSSFLSSPCVVHCHRTSQVCFYHTANTTTSLTEDYNLELSYRKPFLDIWRDEKNDPDLGPLSERMGVRDRETGALMMTPEEQEAASEYPKPDAMRTWLINRLLPCVLLLQSVVVAVLGLYASLFRQEYMYFPNRLA